MRTLTVVGVGADGWSGLARPSQLALLDAVEVVGSARQLDLLPPEVTARRTPWPSPMLPAVAALAGDAGGGVCVLASGDPSFYGVATTLARELAGRVRLRVLPHPSSVSLACARLGWAVEGVQVVSLVARPAAALVAALHPGARLLVLSQDGASPAVVAALLTGAGYGASRLSVLQDLGAPDERRVDAVAASWQGTAGPLNVVAVTCVADAGTVVLPRVPGLPDDAFVGDGQMTKREVRAVTLARLAPVPGELLWDVGAGSGTIAVEWARTHPTCRAVAVETRADRAATVTANAGRLGVPDVQVVHGPAPQALAGLDRPDAVFVGGGITVPGVFEACWAALRPGGRLVVNAVTVESEAAVLGLWAAHGGDLARITVSRAAPVGGFTGWRTAMPVVQWVAVRPAE